MKIKITSLPKHSFADGGDTGNGVTVFHGLKHGQFGLEGIPQGIASDGMPNYVQGGGFNKNGNPLKGEIKYKDYIYGKLKITKKLADKYNLPEKWVGLKYQEAADDAQQESKDRPNDPISLKSLDEWMIRLQGAQEEQKLTEATKEASKAVDNMSDEEKAALLSSLGQSMSQQEGVDLSQPMFAEGGKLIKPNWISNSGHKMIWDNKVSPKSNVLFDLYMQGPALQGGKITGISYDYNKTVQNSDSPLSDTQTAYITDDLIQHPDGTTTSMYRQSLNGHGFNKVTMDNPMLKWIDQENLERSLRNDYSIYQPLSETINTFAKGGKIHIAKNKRGTFTAAAKKRGMGVQEFASKVLAHPENYTEAMRKKAQFAHNAKSFKHAEGGHLYPDGGTTNLQFPYDVYYQEPANWKEKPSSLLPWSNSDWLPKIKSEYFGDFLPFVQFDRRFIDMPEYMRPDLNEAARNFITIGPDLMSPLKISTTNEFKDESPLSLNVVDFDRDVKKLSTPIAATPAPIPTHETSPKKDARRINKAIRDLDDNATSNNEWMRYMPAVGAGIGALIAGLQPVDYSYPNELRSLASQYKPIGAPSIGGYRRYNPYDVNLGDVENLALQTAALNANKGQNRATQGVLNTAVIAKSQEASAKRNLAAQQANEANRLAVDTYNLGIDQTNANLVQAYDQLNQQINNNRINMLARAAQEADSSRTAWSNMLNTTGTNFFNQLGNVGRDEWNRNQYLAWLAQHPAAAKAMGIEV